MPARDPAFRRLVIGFQDASGSPAGLETAVQLARALAGELLGVFVEDTALMEWSSVRPMREQSAGPRAPAAVTPERLSADFAAAAAMVRGRLSRLAEAAGLGLRFEVARASAASLDFAGRQPGDLLALLEPADRMARLSYPFAGLRRAVVESAAPVLYLPHGVQRRRGPVVSVAPSAGDHAVAAAVAAALGEPLVALEAPFGPDAIDRALAGMRESLLVLRRPALPGSDGFTLAAQRLVPALIAGDAAAGPAVAGRRDGR